MSRGSGEVEVAVVGSGLAGLTAAWLLGEHARVTVYEEHATPGMGAHSIRLGPDGPLVDVPLRVFTPAYYPTLLSLYDSVDIRIVGVDYSGSFSRLGEGAYFRYRNVRVGPRSFPLTPLTTLRRRAAREIIRDVFRLHREGPGHLASGRMEGLTLRDYLRAERYTDAFVEGFLLPTYAAVCTCATESVAAYPAEVIVGYVCSGVATVGVMRSAGGTEAVMGRLLERAVDVRTSTRVRRVRPVAGGVEVCADGAGPQRFDHVVLASRADQGAAMLDGDPVLAGILGSVPHEDSRIVVHRDPALAHRDPGDWRPVNMVLADGAPAPMATIWLNRVQSGLEHQGPVFQTWNPVVEPDPDLVITEARVTRPLVTVGTRDVPERLRALDDQPDRRIWAVGSYAESGIPLLESAASSAVRVVGRITGG